MVHCDEHISDTTPQFTGWSMTMTMKIINKTEKKVHWKLPANFGLRLITVADTRFPRGGTYYSATLSRKLHGNEETFVGGSKICLCISVSE